MPRENEVGAVWKKSNDKGDYLSISLDLDALLQLTGGATGKVDIKAYPIEFEKTNPNAPDLRLKYYPKGTGTVTRVRRPSPPPLLDDDIPF